MLSVVGFAQVDTLTVQKCVEITLKNNTSLKLGRNAVELTEASSTISRSTLFPQLSIQSGVTRNGGTFFSGPTSRTSFYNNYSVGVQGQQLIYDFGKTFSKISAASDLQSASSQDLLSLRETIVANTYQAYFQYLEAKRLREASADVLQQAQAHLEQSKAFFNVGKTPQFDVLKASTDVENAKVNLLNAENNVQISKLQLENTINQKLHDDGKVYYSDILESKQDTINEAAALENAMNNRPELLAGKLRIDAGNSLVTNAWAAGFPTLSASGGYFYRSFDYDQKFLDSWNIGLTLSVPLFQGFGLDAGIDQAKTNVKIAESQLDLTQQSITLDVRQQYYNLKLAQGKIEASKSLLTQATETLKLAEARYKQEVGSPVEVTDARVSFFNAEVLYIQSLYDYQVAHVRLQRAMGTLK